MTEANELALHGPREGTRRGIAVCVWSSRWGDFRVVRDPGDLEAPAWRSRLWICWVCGEIWARECLLDCDVLQEFELIHAPCGCAEGEYWDCVPGSLTLNTRFPLDTFLTLPLALQRREADFLLGAISHES